MKKFSLFLAAILTFFGMQTVNAQTEYEYVDLGLPSGTLWATCNVGANSPEDYGDYFAWGETASKRDGTWNTYQLCKSGNSSWLTKYVSDPSSSYTGDVDLKTKLDAEDDAAIVKWGSEWQMPSMEQCDELCNDDYTTQTMTTQNGVYGMLITSKTNGNSIFLPAAGRYYNTELDRAGTDLYYWSRTRETYDNECAWCMVNDRGHGTTIDASRCFAQSIRPVRVQHEYVDLGLPSGTLWATCNVGANSPEEFGDYFAWGETQPKTYYSWDTYFDTDDGGETFKKYKEYNNGKTELLPEDDAATVNWGSKWKTPSREQCEELIHDKYTTIEGTKLNGVYGFKITSKTNGKSIFLPACGSRDSSNCDTGLARYWIRSLYWYDSGKCLGSVGTNFFTDGLRRCRGLSVRPVLDPDTPILIVKSIELSLTSLDLLIDETRTITAKVQPATAVNKNVIWSSSNSSVATVDQSGNVTGKTIGSCTITCSATDGSGEKSECQVIVTEFNSETIDGRDYVDLGLPSGTLWATCNVGANSPEEFGDYFAWGETEPKSNYSWSTYKYGQDNNKLTKYCPSSEWGYNGFTDSLTELEPEDDAATANWGSEWQTPNVKQVEELAHYRYTTRERTTYKGVNGYKITSNSNGNCIFLPTAGRYEGTSLYSNHYFYNYDYYWTRSLKIDDPTSAYFTDKGSGYWMTSRSYGQSVRPVRTKKEVYTEFVEETGTLTYYYDNRRSQREGVTELYDPVNDPDVARFTGYNKKILKAVIDKSMKDAHLTSTYSMFFGGINSETFAFQTLHNMTEIKGMENLNTANVTRMDWMFEACNSLQTIDVSSFDVSNVTKMDYMFGDCYKLTTIYCNDDWSTSTASDISMFSFCNSLVGGEGTTFDNAFTDNTYARPDGVESKPGYFTLVTRKRGDVNNDGSVNTADVVAVYSYIEKGDASGFDRKAADVNNDGSVNTADVVAIYSIIIKGE